jgi:hypothetical protein
MVEDCVYREETLEYERKEIIYLKQYCNMTNQSKSLFTRIQIIVVAMIAIIMLYMLPHAGTSFDIIGTLLIIIVAVAIGLLRRKVRADVGKSIDSNKYLRYSFYAAIILFLVYEIVSLILRK